MIDMPSNDAINKVIARQEAMAKDVAKLQKAFKGQEAKYLSYFSLGEKVKNLDGLGIPSFSTRLELTEYLADIKKNNQEKDRQLKDVWQKIFKDKEPFDFRSYDKTKYDYYAKLFDYYRMLEDDRDNLFAADDKEKIGKLAKKGWFLFYENVPVVERLLPASQEQWISAIVNWLSINDYQFLFGMFSEVLSQKRNLNQLEKAKLGDVREDLVCLKSQCFNSCARTMVALLENEHHNASSIYSDCFEDGKANGDVRAKAKDEQIKHLISYQDFWKEFNAFYKLFNSPEGFESFSRNDLVHGVYARPTTAKDCIQPILAYLSFKKLSFLLQAICDFRNSLCEDLDIANAVASPSNHH